VSLIRITPGTLNCMNGTRVHSAETFMACFEAGCSTFAGHAGDHACFDGAPHSRGKSILPFSTLDLSLATLQAEAPEGALSYRVPWAASIWRRLLTLCEAQGRVEKDRRTEKKAEKRRKAGIAEISRGGDVRAALEHLRVAGDPLSAIQRAQVNQRGETLARAQLRPRWNAARVMTLTSGGGVGRCSKRWDRSGRRRLSLWRQRGFTRGDVLEWDVRGGGCSVSKAQLGRARRAFEDGRRRRRCGVPCAC
jgi:hypothetical protein